MAKRKQFLIAMDQGLHRDLKEQARAEGIPLNDVIAIWKRHFEMRLDLAKLQDNIPFGPIAKSDLEQCHLFTVHDMGEIFRIQDEKGLDEETLKSVARPLWPFGRDPDGLTEKVG